MNEVMAKIDGRGPSVRIVEAKGKGRCLVASKSLLKGTLLWVESPAVSVQLAGGCSVCGGGRCDLTCSSGDDLRCEEGCCYVCEEGCRVK